MRAADTDPGRFSITLRGPRLVYGETVAETELTSELDLLHAERVLVLSSARELAVRGSLLAPLGDRIVGHFTDVRRHVPQAVADAATDLARNLGVDCLLSMGGGSAVGTAKAIALTTELPIIALPTTYAGSEVTPVYGITNASTKRTGRSDLVLPRTVLLDPAMTWDLPLDLTRYSAVNALAHCVSGIFARGRSPITDLLAAEGARLLSRGLRGITESFENRGARADLTQGSYLAGTVLAHAGTSLHHTICHILGGTFDLPHAETHAAVLPAASAVLQERDPDAAERLAVVLGPSGLSTGINDLLEAVGAVARLRDLGLRKTELPRAANLLTGVGQSREMAGLSVARASQLLEEAWG